MTLSSSKNKVRKLFSERIIALTNLQASPPLLVALFCIPENKINYLCFNTISRDETPIFLRSMVFILVTIQVLQYEECIRHDHVTSRQYLFDSHPRSTDR